MSAAKLCRCRSVARIITQRTARGVILMPAMVVAATVVIAKMVGGLGRRVPTDITAAIVLHIVKVTGLMVRLQRATAEARGSRPM